MERCVAHSWGAGGEGVDRVFEGEAVDALQDSDHRRGQNRRTLRNPGERRGSAGRPQRPKQGDDPGDDDQAGGELTEVHGDPVAGFCVFGKHGVVVVGILVRRVEGGHDVLGDEPAE
jgi:hypothetical protein